ncbi:GumC family protein [Megasphaera sueciensis]|uniref:GumC family protein n=1 Tax=Megasphaera sueciensis TaxID=349094 RepID=UPI003D023BE4
MEEEMTIDLRELLQVVNDHKKIIAAITSGFLLCAGVYLLVVSPTYESVSLVRVKQEKGLGDSILKSITGGNDMEDKKLMMTDAEILKSRNVVIPVIRATEKKDKDGKYPGYEEYVKGHIKTTPFKDTEILQIAVSGTSPEQAQKANTLLVQGFMGRLTEMSHDEQKSIRQFLEKRLTSSKQELTEAETKLQQYQVANKVYSPSEQMKGLTDKLSMVDKAKADNQLALETAQAALASVNGQLESAGKSIADSPAIQQYKKQLAELESTKASYVGKYTEDHPKMQEINNQIAATQDALHQEISKIVAQEAPSSSTVQQKLMADKFQNEAAIAVAQGKNQALADLDAQNNTMIATLPVQEQGFVRAKRDADVAQEIYVMLAKRLEEAKVAEAMVPTEVQVVDAATLPERPIKPRKALTLVLAAVLGILCSIVLVVARYLLNRKIRTADDVEQLLHLPVLGMVPDADHMKEKNRYRGVLAKVRDKLWRK